jgi:hypothetical protein
VDHLSVDRLPYQGLSTVTTITLIAFGSSCSRADSQALIDGPTTSVPRQAIAYRHLILTPYTITTLPRAAGSGAIKKAFEKAQVVEKWEASSWAKKLAARASRKVSALGCA